ETAGPEYLVRRDSGAGDPRRPFILHFPRRLPISQHNPCRLEQRRELKPLIGHSPQSCTGTLGNLSFRRVRHFCLRPSYTNSSAATGSSNWLGLSNLVFGKPGAVPNLGMSCLAVNKLRRSGDSPSGVSRLKKDHLAGGASRLAALLLAQIGSGMRGRLDHFACPPLPQQSPSRKERIVSSSATRVTVAQTLGPIPIGSAKPPP